MILCSVNQKRHCIKVETINNVHGYVMDGVNYDTVSYLVYNSPHSQRLGCSCDLNLSITFLQVICCLTDPCGFVVGSFNNYVDKRG